MEADHLISTIAGSPWFQVAAGGASILGLLAALYPTQVRPLPRSHYRSLAWRRVLLVSFGAGLAVFAALKFYDQTPPPGFTIFRWLHDGLHGVPAADSVAGPNLWGALLAVGLFVVWWGFDELEFIVASIGAGVAAVSLFYLYRQAVAPGFVVFRWLYDFLHGIDAAHRTEGTNAWGVLTTLGGMLLILGWRIDPVERTRQLVRREESRLNSQRAVALEALGDGADPERLAGVNEYYDRALRQILDILLGDGSSDRDRGTKNRAG